MTGSRMRKPVYVRLSPAEGQADTAWIAAELDRLEMLVPEVAAGGQRDPLIYALAYIEHYHGDVLGLEHEHEFLAAAALQAWQRAEYGTATRLIAGLAPIFSRLDDSTEAVRLLRIGIDASQRTQDVLQRARFLSCLGGVLITQGRYVQGHQFWFSGLELGKPYGPAAGVWEPLLSFVTIADILGRYDAAHHYATAMLKSCAEDDAESVAVALFIRGLYARGLYDLDRAYDDFCQALRLLSGGTTPSPNRQLLRLAVQTEWSRLQDSYARSQMYAGSALALAEIFSDRYTVATLLIDQANFTRQYGTHEDTRTTYLRLRAVAHQMQARHVHDFGRTLERYLDTTASRPLALPSASTTCLSEREAEVLRLVAVGLSNQQIAEQLVITPGTVKKHLEHIYTKLDVHSRTAAVARARMPSAFS